MGKSDKKRKRESHSESDESGAARRKKTAHKHARSKGQRGEKSERKLLKEAKKFLKQQLKGGEKTSESLPEGVEVPTIGDDAYYERNPEFTAWLRSERGQFFSDLPGSEARELFRDFVVLWNGRKLQRKYYEGITPTDARRSKHDWAVKGRSVEDVQLGIAAAMDEEAEARAAAQHAQRTEQRRWKNEQKLLMDEMLPKATGREALVEKRVARREDARAREASPDMVGPPGGSDVYGDDDSFAAAKARGAHRDEWKGRRAAQQSELAAAKLRDAQAREAERMAQFRALAARGPISIAKRQ